MERAEEPRVLQDAVAAERHRHRATRLEPAHRQPPADLVAELPNDVIACITSLRSVSSDYGVS